MLVFISVYGMRLRLVLIGVGYVNWVIVQSAVLLGFDIVVVDIYCESFNFELFLLLITFFYVELFGAVVEVLDIRFDNFVLIVMNNQDCEVFDKFIEQFIVWLGLLVSRRKVQFFLR